MKQTFGNKKLNHHDLVNSSQPTTENNNEKNHLLVLL